MGKTVILEPGDRLIIKIEDCMIGKSKASLMTSELSYDDVRSALVKGKVPKAGRLKTPEVKTSRQILLLVRAYKCGKWTTGAPIEKSEIESKLQAILEPMSPYAARKLTDKAQEALRSPILPVHIAVTVNNLLGFR